MSLQLEMEQEEDRRARRGPGPSGVTMTCGATPAETRAKVQALALRVVADRLEHGEAGPDLLDILIAACPRGQHTRGTRVLGAPPGSAGWSSVRLDPSSHRRQHGRRSGGVRLDSQCRATAARVRRSSAADAPTRSLLRLTPAEM